MKKTLIFLFLSAIIIIMGMDMMHVKASSNQLIVYEEYSNVQDYRSNTNQAPTKKGYLFAGWYESPDDEMPIKEKDADSISKAYAKFVDEEVLSVKCQLTVGTTVESERTDARVVTTVDSLNYRKVGFRIYAPNLPIIELTSRTVYEKIYGYEDNHGICYEPSVFSMASDYFMAYAITDITNEFFSGYFGEETIIKPFWETIDGTIVYGCDSCYIIGEEIQGKESIYGKGLFIYPTAKTSGATFTVDEALLHDGGYDGKTYTRIGVQKNGQSGLEIQATSEAGLKPNTEYEVKVQVSCEGGSGNLYYESHGILGLQSDFKFDVKGGQIVFTTITDGNGEFSKKWDTVQIGRNATYIHFLQIQYIENPDKGLFETKEIIVDYKSNFCLLDILNETDTFDNSELYNPSGKLISMKDGYLYVDMQGTYELVLYHSKMVYKLKVADLSGPYVRLKNQSLIVDQHEDVTISPVIIDNLDANISTDTLSYSVTKDGINVPVTNHSFVANELGEYVIAFDLKDSAGNPAEEVVIQCIRKEWKNIYGRGISILPEHRHMGAEFEVTDVEIKEGPDKGKTYTRLDRTGNGGSFDLTIVATRKACLYPNTEYTVKVAVACDGGNVPAFYEQHGDQYDFMFDQNGGNIVFTITTDDNGEFRKKWETAYINTATYVEFTGIELQAHLSSVYGAGITILPEIRHQQAVFKVSDVFITEGMNAGKTYVRLDRTGNGGYHDLTISASREAGLLANTEYIVEVAVSCNGGNVPAYYEQHGNQYDFMFDQAGGNIVFTITTDGNGEFTKKWETAYINTATYVEYTGISIEKVESEVACGSVYGAGITILPEMRNQQAIFTVSDIVITEGTNVGKTYVRLDRTGNGGYHDLTIAASSEAGLTANTKYEVCVSVKCDGGNVPAYYEQHGDQYDFMFDQAGGNIVFTITTDENGAFRKKWETAYINTATYVEYTGISIMVAN